MHFKDIVLERRGPIVCVTLNRPDRANAISREGSAELLQVFQEYRDDPEQWVRILTGAGDKAFCSGMYVTEAAQKTSAEGQDRGLHDIQALDRHEEVVHRTNADFVLQCLDTGNPKAS